jgi:hypothetical protein
VLPGNDGDAVFVQQRCQPLHHEKQIAFHQPHRYGCGDGGNGTNAGGIRNRLFLPLLLLLYFPLAVLYDPLRTRLQGDAPGRLAPRRPCAVRRQLFLGLSES